MAAEGSEDDFWDDFARNYEANRCPWCKGHGRVGLFACNACGATGQRQRIPDAVSAPSGSGK